jgi:RNA polymerase sigma factor (sigma-70 family)
MPHVELGTLLRHLRTLAGSAPAADDSDGQLLERFVARQDEVAFAALLQRHGPMVLAVCRRHLASEHDAEDAFQATFLVLARKAASIRRPDSVAGWLHGVAHRTAVKLRSATAVRRRHEAQARPATPDDPLQAITLRELEMLLDAEVRRLPPRYREPFVLCCLQGQSKPAAARALGWKEGTVSGNLARARDLLRGRLTRRGITLSGGLAAVWLGEGTAGAALPTALTAATLQAAVSRAAGTSTAATLADGVVRSLGLGKLKTAALLMLLAGLLATGGVLAYQANRIIPPPDQAKPAADLADAAGPDVNQPAPEYEAAPLPNEPRRLLSASGQVVDSQGKPVVGAAVYLREWAHMRAIQFVDKKGIQDILAQTTTDAQGRFAFKDVPALRWPDGERNVGVYWFPWEVLVIAPGHGLAWKQLTPHNQRQPLTLILPAEARFEGRVLGSGGKPLAGAQVKVQEIGPLDQRPHENIGTPCYLDLQWSQLPPPVRTDGEGRFVLRNLPPNRRVTITLDAAYHLHDYVYAATTREPQPKVVERTYSHENGVQKEHVRELPAHTAPFSVTLRPAHRVRGQVVLADDGKPVAGAWVGLISPEGYHEVRTDRGGRFDFDGCRPGEYELYVLAPTNAEYLSLRDTLTIPAERAEVERVVRVQRGTAVRGRVVDEQSGQGIPGVQLQARRKAAPGEEAFGGGPIVGLAQTGPDGRFQVHVPSGKRRLVLAGSVPGYLISDPNYGRESDLDPRYVQSVDVRPNQPPAEVAFRLNRGLVLTGRVLDPEGKPVGGAQVRTQHKAQERLWSAMVYTDAQGHFTLGGLTAGQQYVLDVTVAKRPILARVVVPTVKNQKPAPLEIRLEPAATLALRVVDENGKPVPDAVVDFQLPVGDDRNSFWIITDFADGNGRFNIPCLLPNVDYTLIVWAPGYTGTDRQRVRAEPGQTCNLGDVAIWTADQSVAGVVVDRAGKALEGIVVSAGPVGLNPVYKGFGTTLTDRQGRFRILGLPRGLLLLNAHPRTAPGEHADPEKTVRAHVQAGTQDVRLELPVAGGKPADEDRP